MMRPLAATGLSGGMTPAVAVFGERARTPALHALERIAPAVVHWRALGPARDVAASDRGSVYFCIQTIAQTDRCSTAFPSTTCACSSRQPMKEAFRRADADCEERSPSSAKRLQIWRPSSASSYLIARAAPRY